MISKGEHIQLSSLDDHKDVQPILILGALAGSLPILLAAQHTLLRPRGPKKGEFLIADANCGGIRAVTMLTSIVIFLRFPDNGVRKVGGEAQCGCKERRA